MTVCTHWRCGVGVDVSIDEVLKDQLGVFEVRGGVVVGLAVDLAQGFLEVLVPPYKSLHVYLISVVPGWSSKYSFCFTSSCDLR